MRLGVLFSGGKDSCLALYRSQNFHSGVCLITIISRNPESYMFHTPNIELTNAQAECAGLELIKEETSGEKEVELDDLIKAITYAKMNFNIEGVVTGGIKSIYQTTRIQTICHNLDLWCFNHLWQRNQIELMNEIVSEGFEVVISGVYAFPLDESFLGRKIDPKLIEELTVLEKKYDINPGGEGGEIETTVLDAPFFKKKIEILNYKIFFNGNSGILQIKKFGLIRK